MEVDQIEWAGHMSVCHVGRGRWMRLGQIKDHGGWMLWQTKKWGR